MLEINYSRKASFILSDAPDQLRCKAETLLKKVRQGRNILNSPKIHRLAGINGFYVASLDNKWRLILRQPDDHSIEVVDLIAHAGAALSGK